MNFLALIIALLVRQVRGIAEQVNRSAPWWHWLAWTRHRLSDGLLQLLVAVVLPVLLVAWLLALLKPLLFGLVWLAVAVWLLLYSFGRGDFQADLRRYRDLCAAGNAEGAWLHASERFGGPAPESAEDLLALQQQVEARMCYEGYQRWFAVVFWFLLLGPAAALGYRLLQWYAREVGAASAGTLLYLLDWLPLRLLAVAFALAGDFVASRRVLGDGLLTPDVEHAGWLGQVGLAASGASPAAASTEDIAGRVDALSALLARSVVVWITAIALLAILG